MKPKETPFTAVLYDRRTGQTATINERDLEYWTTGLGRCDEVRAVAMGLVDYPEDDFMPTYNRFVLSGVDTGQTLQELNTNYSEGVLKKYEREIDAVRGGREVIDTDAQKLFRCDIVEVFGNVPNRPNRAIVLFSNSDVIDGGDNNTYALQFIDGGREAWYPLEDLRYLHQRASESDIQGYKPKYGHES